MTAAALLQYLDNPEMLQKLSYEELKTLVIQYPYCQNLRWLLWRRSQIDGRPEEDRNRQMMATYSFNRTLLYRQHNEPPMVVSALPTIETRGEAMVLQPFTTIPERIEAFQLPSLSKLEQLMEAPAPVSFGLQASDMLTFAPLLGEQIAPLPQVPIDEAPLLSTKFVHFDHTEMAAEAPNPLVEPTRELLPISTNETVENEVTATEEIFDLIPLSELMAPVEPKIVEALTFRNDGILTLDMEETPHTEGIQLETSQPNWAALMGEPAIVEQKDEIVFEVEMAKGDPIPAAAIPPSFSDWLRQFKTAKDIFEPTIAPPAKEQAPIVLTTDSAEIPTEVLEEATAAPAPLLETPLEAIQAANLVPAETWNPVHETAEDEDDDELIGGNMPIRGEGYDVVAEVVEGSVRDSFEVVTETLADILALQGRFSKAIRMYKILMVRVPEKSRFFAQKIEVIEQNLKKDNV